MAIPIRQNFHVLTLAVASILLAGSALVQPVVGADYYIPTADEVNRTLAPIGYTAEPAEINYEAWDAGSYFHVSGGPTPIYELWLAASALPTVEEAEGFFREEASLLASDQESAHVRTPHPDDTPGADDARDLRVIFVGRAIGRCISRCMRLVRVGAVVALVKATGSPEADDPGAVDSDRARVRLTDLVLVKVREAAPIRSPTDQARTAWQVSASHVPVARGSSRIDVGLREEIGIADLAACVRCIITTPTGTRARAYAPLSVDGEWMWAFSRGLRGDQRPALDGKPWHVHDCLVLWPVADGGRHLRGSVIQGCHDPALVVRAIGSCTSHHPNEIDGEGGRGMMKSQRKPSTGTS